VKKVTKITQANLTNPDRWNLFVSLFLFMMLFFYLNK
jgi:hypothetical protein